MKRIILTILFIFGLSIIPSSAMTVEVSYGVGTSVPTHIQYGSSPRMSYNSNANAYPIYYNYNQGYRNPRTQRAPKSYNKTNTKTNTTQMSRLNKDYKIHQPNKMVQNNRGLILYN